MRRMTIYEIKFKELENVDYLSTAFFILRYDKEIDKYYWFDLTENIKLENIAYDNAAKAEEYLNILLSNGIILSWKRK